MMLSIARACIVVVGLCLAIGCASTRRRDADSGSKGSAASAAVTNSSTAKRTAPVIIDKLENADRYYGRHPGFRAAFEFLKTQNLDSLTPGRREIDGARLYALISQDRGRGKAAAKLEAHRRYIDIQYVVAGDEVIGLRLTNDCRDVAVAYDAARDICFFADAPTTWVSLPKGSFIILFLEDAHAPLAGEGDLRKAVVKVAIEW